MAEKLTRDAEAEFAESDFRQLVNVVDAFQRARLTLSAAVRGRGAINILNIARVGSEYEPASAGPDDRPVFGELVLDQKLLLARELAHQAAFGEEPTPDMVRRASHILNDLWNGDPDTIGNPNEALLEYIRTKPNQ